MRKKKQTAICLLTAALLCVSCVLYREITARRTAVRYEKPVPVLTLAAQAVSNRISCRGRLEYGMEYDVCTDRPVRILSVQTRTGSLVERGAPLFTLEPVLQSDPLSGFDLQGEIVAAFSDFRGGNGTHGQPAVIALAASGRQTLYSPAAGLITELAVSPSQTAAAGRTLLTLADPTSLQVRAPVPEAYVQELAVGLECSITGEAFRDRVYSGSIREILPYAYQTGTLNGAGDTVVDVLVSIDDPDDVLREGYSAHVEIRTPARADTLLVPYEAVRQDEAGTEYVLIAEEGAAVRRDIRTGYDLRDSVEIVSGCGAGDRVILEPDGIGEHDRVRPVEVLP